MQRSIPLRLVLSKAALLVRSCVMAVDAVLAAVSLGLLGYYLFKNLPGVTVIAAIFLLAALNLLALWRMRPNADNEPGAAEASGRAARPGRPRA